MDQSLKAVPKAKKKKEPVEEEPMSKKRDINPTSLSRGFKTREVRITKIPKHFQAKKTKNILILMAFSMGLGSMWRFPYLCHQNGGGSFLLVYLILLLLVGIPLLYMEMIIGQWLRMDNIQAWKKLVPWLTGLGYSSTLACMLVSLYNSALISWNLLYLGQSFDYPLPWEHCQVYSRDHHGNINATEIQCLRTVPYQYFWYHTTLQASSQVEEGIEVLVLNIALCLFATWVVLYIVLIFRIKISVLTLIFSIFFPYVLLFCFLIRSLFLQGAMASLRRLVTTELSVLSSLDTWRQAGGHVLFSLGLGMGTIITFSSYQTRGDNYIKLASFMAMANLVTSLLSTSIIFLVLGFWTTTSGPSCVESRSVSNLVDLIAKGVLPQAAWPPQDIIHKPPLEYLDWISQLPMHLQENMVHFSVPCSILVQKEKFMEGPGLAYVAFSQVISLFPGSSFWAIVFFMALVIMGLGTLTTLLESIVLSLQNNIPTFAKYPKLIPVTVCLGGLLGSLVFSSRSGSYVVFLFDDHLVPMVLVIIVVLQNLSLAWVYGISRFKTEMFGRLYYLVWVPSTLWKYVTLPTLLALFTIYFLNLYHRESLYYVSWNDSMSQEVKQPYQKIVLDWVTFLSVLALLPIPVYLLQHWWYLDNQVICEDFKKPSSPKMTETGSNKVSQSPAYPLRRLTLRRQDKGDQVPLPSKNPTGAFFLQPPNLLTESDSESSSGFSL